MMRFDVVCKLRCAPTPGQDLHLSVLPAQTRQQQILHEAIWVEGCLGWTASAQPDGARVLNLLGCSREVRVALAASLSVAPVWRDAATLREWSNAATAWPGVYSSRDDRWPVECIAPTLGPTLRNPASVFEALPELLESMREGVDANELRRHARVPVGRVGSPSWARDRRLEPLEVAVAMFCMLGVPARIAVGFAPESRALSPCDDARAFYLELYGEGRWWVFEPDGQVPAFGFIRTAVGSELSDLALLRGNAPAGLLRMDASVDPPPAWGLPPRASNRVLLSLDARVVSSAAAQEIEYEQDGNGNSE